MQILEISETIVTPSVLLDYANNKYAIIGKSLPENPSAFYAPIIEWFNELLKIIDPSKKIVLEVRYEYFNTASSKLFLDIVDVLHEFQEKDIVVCIEWQYEMGDENMKESGETYVEFVDVPFVFKEV